jgi:hypothetical protein
MSIVTIVPLPTLLLVAATAVAATGCGVTGQMGDDTTRRIERETISIADVERVDVSTDNGRIDLVASPAATDVIEIEIVLEESRQGDADYSLEVVDGTLDLDGECDGGLFRQCSVVFVVTMPADLAADIETDNGAIVVDGMSGPIDIETDNGAVTGDDLESADVSVRTNNGRIRLVFDDAPSTVEARTDNGAIDVLVPDDGTLYDVDADSDNGSVDVDVPTMTGAERTITADTDNGSIDVDVRR